MADTTSLSESERSATPTLKFSMALGGQKSAKRNLASSHRHDDAVRKRPKFGDQDDSDEEGATVEHITGIEGNVVQSLKPKKVKKALVIPAQPNADWREATRKRQIFVPNQGQPQFTGPTQPEILGSMNPTTGLQFTTQRTETTSHINGQTEETRSTTVVSTTETVVVQPPATEEAPAGAQDDIQKAAMDAILAEARGDAPAQATRIIPAASTPTDTDIYREDVALRPEAPALEDYENTPVEEFGAALLRGMGWKDGEGLGKRGNATAAYKPVQQRQHLLGLGAKPDPSLTDENGPRKSMRHFFDAKDQKLVVKRRKDGSTSDRDSDRRSEDLGYSDRKERDSHRRRDREDGHRDRRDRDRREDDRRYNDKRDRDSDRDSDRRRDRHRERERDRRDYR